MTETTPVADGGKITRALETCGYPFEATDDGWLVNGEANPVLEHLLKHDATIDGIVTDCPWMSVATAYPTSSGMGAKVKSKTSGKQWSDVLTLKMAYDRNFWLLRQLQNDECAAVLFCGTVSGAMFTQIAYGLWDRCAWLTWDKGAGRVWMPFTCLPEYMVFCAVRQIHKPWDMPVGSAVFRVKPVPPKERIHPAEKPVELLESMVRLTTPPNGVVIDPFAGSFSTMRAARNVGRRFLCVEADEEFYARGVEKAQKEGTRKHLL